MSDNMNSATMVRLPAPDDPEAAVLETFRRLYPEAIDNPSFVNYKDYFEACRTVWAEVKQEQEQARREQEQVGLNREVTGSPAPPNDSDLLQRIQTILVRRGTLTSSWSPSSSSTSSSPPSPSQAQSNLPANAPNAPKPQDNEDTPVPPREHLEDGHEEQDRLNRVNTSQSSPPRICYIDTDGIERVDWFYSNLQRVQDQTNPSMVDAMRRPAIYPGELNDDRTLIRQTHASLVEHLGIGALDLPAFDETCSSSGSSPNPTQPTLTVGTRISPTPQTYSTPSRYVSQPAPLAYQTRADAAPTSRSASFPTIYIGMARTPEMPYLPPNVGFDRIVSSSACNNEGFFQHIMQSNSPWQHNTGSHSPHNPRTLAGPATSQHKFDYEGHTGNLPYNGPAPYEYAVNSSYGSGYDTSSNSNAVHFGSSGCIYGHGASLNANYEMKNQDHANPLGPAGNAAFEINPAKQAFEFDSSPSSWGALGDNVSGVDISVPAELYPFAQDVDNIIAGRQGNLASETNFTQQDYVQQNHGYIAELDHRAASDANFTQPRSLEQQLGSMSGFSSSVPSELNTTQETYGYVATPDADSYNIPHNQARQLTPPSGTKRSLRSRPTTMPRGRISHRSSPYSPQSSRDTVEADKDMRIENRHDETDEAASDKGLDSKQKPKLNKNGKARKQRQPRAKLRKWDEDDLGCALVAIVAACGEQGFRIPFDECAKWIDPTCTGSALQQSILKTRDRLILKRRSPLPRARMNWPPKPGALSPRLRNLPRRKPTKMQAQQCLIVTLKRAYNDTARTMLPFPYDSTAFIAESEAPLLGDLPVPIKVEESSYVSSEPAIFEQNGFQGLDTDLDSYPGIAHYDYRSMTPSNRMLPGVPQTPGNIVRPFAADLSQSMPSTPTHHPRRSYNFFPERHDGWNTYYSHPSVENQTNQEMEQGTLDTALLNSGFMIGNPLEDPFICSGQR